MDTWQIVLFASAIPLIVLLLRTGKSKSGSVSPGPLFLPVLGSVVWLTTSYADLEPLLRRLFTRCGPVVSLRLGSQLFIFVADRRLAHEALVEHGAALADRPTYSSAMLLGENDNTIMRANYEPVWRFFRRNLVAQTLHPSRIGLFAPDRSWVRRVLVQKLRESETTVVETFQYTMFSLLLVMCFGQRLDGDAVWAIGAAQREQLHYITTRGVNG